MTATGCPPTVRLSEDASSRPRCASWRSAVKYSPDTSCTLPRAPIVSPSGCSCMPATLVAANNSPAARADSSSRACSNVGAGKMSPTSRPGVIERAWKSCCGSGTGSARSTIALTSVKTAVAPPMPRPSDNTAVNVNPTLRRSSLMPKRRSRRNSINMTLTRYAQIVRQREPSQSIGFPAPFRARRPHAAPLPGRHCANPNSPQIAE